MNPEEARVVGEYSKAMFGNGQRLQVYAELSSVSGVTYAAEIADLCALARNAVGTILNELSTRTDLVIELPNTGDRRKFYAVTPSPIWAAAEAEIVRIIRVWNSMTREHR